MEVTGKRAWPFEFGTGKMVGHGEFNDLAFSLICLQDEFLASYAQGSQRLGVAARKFSFFCRDGYLTLPDFNRFLSVRIDFALRFHPSELEFMKDSPVNISAQRISVSDFLHLSFRASGMHTSDMRTEVFDGQRCEREESCNVLYRNGPLGRSFKRCQVHVVVGGTALSTDPDTWEIISQDDWSMPSSTKSVCSHFEHFWTLFSSEGMEIQQSAGF